MVDIIKIKGIGVDLSGASGLCGERELPINKRKLDRTLNESVGEVDSGEANNAGAARIRSSGHIKF